MQQWISRPFRGFRRWKNIGDRVRRFSHKAKKRGEGRGGGEDSCNQYLLLKCRKGLVSNSETILTPWKDKWPTSCQVPKGLQFHLWFQPVLRPAMWKERWGTAPHLHVCVGTLSHANNYHKRVLLQGLVRHVRISVFTVWISDRRLTAPLLHQLSPGRLSQSSTRTEMASSARTTSGTCWPPWANWMWRMRSWRPWWRRPAAPSTSLSSWPCSARSWRVCWHIHLHSSSLPYVSLFVIFPELFGTERSTFNFLFPYLFFFLSFLIGTNYLLLLLGADPEDVIVSAFKVLDPEATGAIKKELYGLLPLTYLLSQQSELFVAQSWIKVDHLIFLHFPSPALRSSWPPSATGSPLRRWADQSLSPSSYSHPVSTCSGF